MYAPETLEKFVGGVSSISVVLTIYIKSVFVAWIRKKGKAAFLGADVSVISVPPRVVWYYLSRPVADRIIEL